MRVAIPVLGLALALPWPATAQVSIFQDGFEIDSTCAWSAAFPDDWPPGVDCGLAAFGPAMSFIDVGTFGAPTYPDSLTARLYRPTPVQIFIPIDSSDPLSLEVEGGGVTLPLGSSEGIVLVNGLQQHPGVTLTASLGTVDFQATVRVVAPGEVPTLVSLLPPSVVIHPGDSWEFEVTLDVPAPPGGSIVDLDATPGLGTLPANVIVPEDEFQATFLYVAGANVGFDTLSATLGATHEAVVFILP